MTKRHSVRLDFKVPEYRMQIVGAIFCLLTAAKLATLLVGWLKAEAAFEARELDSFAAFDQRIAACTDSPKKSSAGTIAWNGYRRFRVRDKVQEAEGTSSFYLVPHDAKPLPAYQPGQYLTVRLNVSDDTSDETLTLVRCYSLSDAPRTDHFRITVKQVPAPPDTDVPPGKVSTHMQNTVCKGDLIDVQAPRGQFCLEATKTTPVVLVAGGVGVTPVLSMLNTIVEAGTDRDVWFFYGVRSGTDHVMRKHLRDVTDAHSNVRLCVCYSSPNKTDKRGIDFHHKGRIDIDLIHDKVNRWDVDYYVCGPQPMMNTLVPALKNQGVPDENIHSEAFGPAAVKTDASNARALNADDNKNQPALKVQFATSGKEACWNGTVDSLLDLGLTHDIPMESGCRAGSCGACAVRIVQGTTDCQMDAAADCETGYCLACVSVPTSDVVIEA